MRKLQWMGLAVLAAAWLAAAPGAHATATSTSISFGSTEGDLRCATAIEAANVVGGASDELVTSCTYDRADDGRSPVIRIYGLDAASGRFRVVAQLESPAGTLGCLDFDHGDVNGDGRDDLVAGCYGFDAAESGVYVGLGAAAGVGALTRLAPPPELASDALPCTQVAVGDLDRDGFADVVGGCASGIITWHGSGSGAVDGSHSVPTERRCGRPRLADIDGNAILDLALTCPAIVGADGLLTVVFRGADGTSWSRSITHSTGMFSCASTFDVGDVSGDARPELLYSCSDGAHGFGHVARFVSADPARPAFSTAYVGSPGPHTITLPWLQARCDMMPMAALHRYGHPRRTIAAGCSGGLYGPAESLVFEARARATSATLVDNLAGPTLPFMYSCGASVVSGDFDGDARSDIARTCGYSGPASGRIEERSSTVAVTLGRLGMRGSARMDLLVGSAGVDVMLGGAGNDLLIAVDRTADRVDCGTGQDRAIVDRRDRVRGCEVVIRR